MNFFFFGCARQIEILWLLYGNRMAIVKVLFLYTSCTMTIQFVHFFHRLKKDISMNTILCLYNLVQS